MAYGEAWAPPATWGPWQELKGSSGGPVATYEVSFDTISDAPSSFSAQVEYVSPNGLQTEKQLGQVVSPSHLVADLEQTGFVSRAIAWARPFGIPTRDLCKS